MRRLVLIWGAVIGAQLWADDSMSQLRESRDEPHVYADAHLMDEPALDFEGKVSERYRIWWDLDRDGDDDLIISETIRGFGNAGGTWSVYRKEADGRLRYLGLIFGKSKGMVFEYHPRNPRIWTYWRSGSSEGAIGYNEIGPDGIEELQSLYLYLHDKDNTIGWDIYEAVFREGNEHLSSRLERSVTVDGEVRWVSDHD